MYSPANTGGLTYVRKTVAFDGTAGNGATGTVAVFTLTGRVYVDSLTAIITEDLASGGAATVDFGTASASWSGATSYSNMTANLWWKDNNPQGDGGIATPMLAGYSVNESFRLTVATANVTNGTIVFDVRYRPLSDGASLVAA